MRDLNIDEDFDIPTNIDREGLIDEIIRFSDIDFPDMGINELENKVGEIVDEHIEKYTHINGKVYVDDWDVFDHDLKNKVIKSICNTD